MHDAVLVQVSNAYGELVGKLTDSIFAQVEVARLQVVEEVGASHVVEHDVVVVAVLKNVDQVDNIGVLAHL